MNVRADKNGNSRIKLDKGESRKLAEAANILRLIHKHGSDALAEAAQQGARCIDGVLDGIAEPASEVV